MRTCTNAPHSTLARLPVPGLLFSIRLSCTPPHQTRPPSLSLRSENTRVRLFLFLATVSPPRASARWSCKGKARPPGERPPFPRAPTHPLSQTRATAPSFRSLAEVSLSSVSSVCGNGAGGARPEKNSEESPHDTHDWRPRGSLPEVEAPSDGLYPQLSPVPLLRQSGSPTQASLFPPPPAPTGGMPPSTAVAATAASGVATPWDGA